MASYVSHWQNATSAAPPFSGAPPIPADVNVPAQQWNAGTWMPNPNFNPLATSPTAPTWMPGHAWHHMSPPQQQQQQQQHYNPYKRQPRQPSAEYLASKLSDNPLGLHNMIPAEELERQEREKQKEAEASTPWFWNPRTLDAAESDDEDSPDQDQAPRSATKNTYAAPAQNQTPERPQFTRASESSTSKGVPQPTFDILSPLVFPMTPKPSSSRSTQGLSRHASVPIVATNLDIIPESFSSRQNSHQNDQQHHFHSRSRPNSRQASRSSSTSTSPYSLPHSGEPSPISPTHPHSSGHSPHNPNFPHFQKSISSRRNSLQDDRQSRSGSRSRPSSRQASRSNSTSTSLYNFPHNSEPSLISPTYPHSSGHSSHNPNFPHSQKSISSRRNSLQDDRQRRSGSRSRPSSRQASRSSSTSTSLYNFPHSSNPSLIPPTYPHSSGHSPHNPNFPHLQTSKNPLPAPPADVAFSAFSQLSSSNATINHTSPGTSNSSYIYTSAAPKHTRSKSHSQQPVPQISGTAIIHSNGTSTLTTLTSSPPRSPQHLERSLSPAHLYPHSHHLQFHPPPDRPSTIIPTSKPKRKTSSTLANGLSTSQMNGPSSSSKPSRAQRRRKGFWNRRGDHVTPDGYIVYAPGPLVYPKDLDDYPDGKDGGYRNENGMKAAWAPRPEISPKDGYESLIEWVD